MNGDAPTKPIEHLATRLMDEMESFARRDPSKAAMVALGMGLALHALPTRAVVSQQPRGRRDGHLAIALAFVGTLWVLACAPAEELDACDACLQSGGTWQVDTCTNDCDLQDTSCFRNACPAPCAADSCGTCFSTSECEAAGCAWHGEAEAQWCTAAS